MPRPRRRPLARVGCVIDTLAMGDRLCFDNVTVFDSSVDPGFRADDLLGFSRHARVADCLATVKAK